MTIFEKTYLLIGRRPEEVKARWLDFLVFGFFGLE